MTSVAYFDPHPTASVETQSPLHHLAGVSAAGETRGDSRVTLTERAFLDHLILRGAPDVLKVAVRDVLGMPLPTRPQELVVGETGTLQWLSPDEWLLIVTGGEGFRRQRALRDALGAAHFSIVDVSGGQTLLTLEGSAAVEVLMKSTVYDVDPRHFPIGKGVTSVFAKATAMIRRVGQQEWELVIRRSFADYCLRWLLDAGEEFAIEWRPSQAAATAQDAAPVADLEASS